MKRANITTNITDQLPRIHFSFGSVKDNDLAKVKPFLLCCPGECGSRPSNGNSRSPKALAMYKDAYILMRCQRCPKEWLLCLECSEKQKKQIESLNQLRNHKKNHHTKKARIEEEQKMAPDQSEDEMEVNHNDDFYDATEDTSFSPNSDHKDWIEVQNSNSLGFVDEASSKYFEQCFLGTSKQAGMNYLATRSSLQDHYTPQDHATMILPRDHAELQVRIANLAYGISRGKVDHLVKVLQGAYRIGCENGYVGAYRNVLKMKEKDPSALDEHLRGVINGGFSHDLVKGRAYTLSTSIPENRNDIRRMYLEGKHSIIANLPCPSIREDVEGHSYTLVSECIRHFLGHGDVKDLADIPSYLADSLPIAVNHPSISKRARAILESCGRQEILPSYILFWSDDVEPNQQKANRGSVWLMTMTIATHLGNGHSMRNTYPLAVGRKGGAHNRVLEKLEEDLASLRCGLSQPFYVGSTKKKIKMAFEIFCTLQDQPEKRDFNFILSGKSNTFARFGVAANHRELYSNGVLQSCTNCIDLLRRELQRSQCAWPLKTCSKCLRWNALDCDNDLVFMNAPDDYPLTSKRLVLVDKKPKWRPFRVSYETLIAAVATAHEEYVNGDWSELNLKAYLKLEGINKDYADTVAEHASRAYGLKLAMQDPETHREILNDFQKRPQYYAQAPLPTAWIRPKSMLELHPDVIMHLVFLGLVKAIVLEIQEWLKIQSKLTSFLKFAAAYLTPLAAMSIDWLPIEPYKGDKLGGWVSENYLAFSRVMLWFYQNLDSAVKESTNKEPPSNQPQHKWLRVHNHYWLKRRGLDTTGNAATLKERVAEAMKNGAPDPIPLPDLSSSNVYEALLALSEVLSCIMSDKVTAAHVNRTRCAIPIFLSAYDKAFKPLRKSTDMPSVLSHFNFLCLLNVPDAMDKFGPMRHLWEGGPRGEGFLRFAKPLMTQGLRKNWHKFLLRKLYRSKAFDNILPNTADDTPELDGLRKHKASFHKYKSAAEVRLHFVSREPVSVLLFELEGKVKIGAVVRDYDNILDITLDDMEPRRYFGLDYYIFTASIRDDGEKWKTYESKCDQIGFGMLLPLKTCEETRYALIAPNWKSLSPSTPITDLFDKKD